MALTLFGLACGNPAIQNSATSDDLGAEVAQASDVSEDGEYHPDVAVDAASGKDTAPPDATSDTIGCPGGSRCACLVDADCESLLCLATSAGRACAAPCADGAGCQFDETCTALTLAGGDSQFVCAPRWVSLCAPCERALDCAYVGSNAAIVCAPLGPAGSFCTSTCQADAECPAKTTCASGICRPITGSCACSPWAAAHKTTTTCLNQNGVGTCASSLGCSTVGPWPACLAPSALTETCNGADDDCDGIADDNADGSCKDLDTCTLDFCNGGACTHVKNAVCGDGECASKCGETKEACPADCHECGNGICETGEGPKNCKVDCCAVDGKAPSCGDGVCSGFECGESATICPTDCVAPCGNGVCEPGESVTECPGDCKQNVCGNAICEPGDGGPTACPKDCATLCGNCVCEGGESSASCPIDCGYCGDSVCSICGGLGEDAKTCPSDCGNIADVGCTLTWQKFCADESPCTADACVPGKGCVHLPATATCSDGDACTSGDACAGALCMPGVITGCDDGNPCTADGCEPATGCTATSVDGVACSDGDACTLDDTCLDGGCTSGLAPDCDDQNVCTTDACAGGLCVHLASPASCTDGNACTVDEHCAKGACVGAKAVSCDDGNACTVNSCEPATGCTSTFADGMACSDGTACTLGDLCSGTGCVGGALTDCDDHNVCTDDSCSDGACSHTTNGSACSDGNICTVGEQCVGKKCAGGAMVNCDDGNTCTSDFCDLATGCTSVGTSTATCTDGDACTVGDACVQSACVPGSAKNCDDSNVCTDDHCSAGTCLSTANTATCDDGNACTLSDTCTATSCVGMANLCSDGNPCTADSCDGASGKCVNTAVLNGTACDDGVACTSGDVCATGTCKGQLKPGFASCTTCLDAYVWIDTNAGPVCAPDQPIWGVRPMSPVSLLTDNADGTLSDSQTKLMWMKSPSPAYVVWVDAVAYCKSQTVASHSDWRLPTAAELLTLVDFTVKGPALPAVVSYTTASDGYWTAVPQLGSTSLMWSVFGFFGVTDTTDRTQTSRVRCVR